MSAAETKQDNQKPQKLGRGLAALLGDEAEDYAALDRAKALKMVSIEMLQPSKAQPRREFNEEGLIALASSLKEEGVLQPLIVRRLEDNSHRFEIIAGERRWRAAQRAGLHQVPVLVKEMTDQQALHIALIENLQRRDLNPIEEAMGFRRLMEEFKETQDEVSKRMGKSRSYIANAVRLLELPGSVRTMLVNGQLTMGHAKVLVASSYPEILAQQVVDRNLSVRDAEKLAAESKAGEKTGGTSKSKTARDPNIVALEKELGTQLGLKVLVDHKASSKSGKLVIHYKSLDQLDTVLGKLKTTG